MRQHVCQRCRFFHKWSHLHTAGHSEGFPLSDCANVTSVPQKVPWKEKQHFKHSNCIHMKLHFIFFCLSFNIMENLLPHLDPNVGSSFSWEVWTVCQSAASPASPSDGIWCCQRKKEKPSPLCLYTCAIHWWWQGRWRILNIWGRFPGSSFCPNFVPLFMFSLHYEIPPC